MVLFGDVQFSIKNLLGIGIGLLGGILYSLFGYMARQRQKQQQDKVWVNCCCVLPELYQAVTLWNWWPTCLYTAHWLFCVRLSLQFKMQAPIQLCGRTRLFCARHVFCYKDLGQSVIWQRSGSVTLKHQTCANRSDSLLFCGVRVGTAVNGCKALAISLLFRASWGVHFISAPVLLNPSLGHTRLGNVYSTSAVSGFTSACVLRSSRNIKRTISADLALQHFNLQLTLTITTTATKHHQAYWNPAVNHSLKTEYNLQMRVANVSCAKIENDVTSSTQPIPGICYKYHHAGDSKRLSRSTP